MCISRCKFHNNISKNKKHQKPTLTHCTSCTLLYQMSALLQIWPDHIPDCPHTSKNKNSATIWPWEKHQKGTTYLHQFSWELISEKFLFLFIVYRKCFFFFLQSLNLLEQRVTDEFFLLLCPCLLWNKDKVLRKKGSNFPHQKLQLFCLS